MRRTIMVMSTWFALAAWLSVKFRGDQALKEDGPLPLIGLGVLAGMVFYAGTLMQVSFKTKMIVISGILVYTAFRFYAAGG
jgi:hypothetical protein